MENNLKAAELRIGNYVLHKIYGISRIQIIGDASKQEYIGGRSLEGNYFSNSHLPIPLTAEWLEKFGFERDKPKQHNGLMIFNSNGLYLHIYTGTEKACLISLSDASVFQFLKPLGGNIQFVHQLQNLYHSLTGEELTIKESENGK